MATLLLLVCALYLASTKQQNDVDCATWYNNENDADQALTVKHSTSHETRATSQALRTASNMTAVMQQHHQPQPHFAQQQQQQPSQQQQYDQSQSAASALPTNITLIQLELTPEQHQQVYTWIDSIPLTRPKRNIYRDCSDATTVAELIGYYYPKLIDLHNYTPSNAINTKILNWQTLNRKVHPKLQLTALTTDEINALASAQKSWIERYLHVLQQRLQDYRYANSGGGNNNSTKKTLRSEDVRRNSLSHDTLAASQPSPMQPTFSNQSDDSSVIQLSTNDVITHYPTLQQNKQTLARPGNKSKKKSAVVTSYSNAMNDQPSKQQQQQNLAKPVPPVEHVPSPLTSAAHSKLTLNQQVAEADPSGAIVALKETNDILQLKVTKLEELLQLKNAKIEALQRKLADATAGNTLKAPVRVQQQQYAG